MSRSAGCTASGERKEGHAWLLEVFHVNNWGITIVVKGSIVISPVTQLSLFDKQA